MNVRAGILRERAFALVAACALIVLSTIAGTRSTALAAESSIVTTKAATAKSPPTLLVLGDSISAEYGLPRDSGWVRLLDARLRERHEDYGIVNASISGETTSGGRARIDELLTRVKPAIVVVELGGECRVCTSDAADEEDSVDLGGRRIIK